MRLSTLIELRRHFRAIDVALKQEIEAEKKPAKDFGHPSCDPIGECQKGNMAQVVDYSTTPEKS